MKIKKYKLKKPINTINAVLVVILGVLFVFSRQWAGIVFFAGAFLNCLYYIISNKNISIKNTLYIICVVIIAQGALLGFYDFTKNILYANGAYVYKSDVEDIINLLENESLNNSFVDKDEYIHMKENLLNKLLIKKSDVEDYLNEAKMLSRQNEMYFSYVSKIEDGKKENEECEENKESIFEKQGTEVFEYIKLSEFEECNLEVLKKRLEEKKNDTLIIDLRGNKGGKRDILIDVASLFLPKDEEIMTIHEKHINTTYFSKGSNYDFDLILFLVDKSTASCAEILALSLKNHYVDKVKVIGNKTVGKGVGKSISKYYESGIEVGVVTSTWTVANQDVNALFEYIEDDSGGRTFESENDYFSVVVTILSEEQ
ncbi:MAG TPA: hypothetical protein GX727_07705 [Clostridium sp.]|nr:hypothetical protein [Clostridium sp.]